MLLCIVRFIFVIGGAQAAAYVHAVYAVMLQTQYINDKNVVIGVTIKNVVIDVTIQNMVIGVTIKNVVIGVTIKNVVIGVTIKMW